MDGLDRYVFSEPIGTGMFATVYAARDDRFDSTVAIKVLAENHSLNPDVRERFITEARALRRLRSRHVVRVHDLGESDRGQPFIVLDHCAGGTLADRVARRDPTAVPSRREVRQLVDALADGLGEMHRHRLVHRDLSPYNLLLRNENERADSEHNGVEPAAADDLFAHDSIVISDLGFVKDLDAASGLTASGGTRGFAAPEQDRPGALVDQRSDVFAASAVLRWFIRGGHSELATVIDRGTAHDPSERQPTIEAWAAEVREALGGFDAQGRRDASADERPPRRRRGRWPLTVAAAIVLVALGVLLGANLPDSDDTMPASRTLANGETELRSDAGEVVLTVTGPLEFERESPATFVARTSGSDELLWIAPDGTIVRDSDTLTLDAATRGAGSFAVVAIGGGDRAMIEVNFLVI